MAWVRRPKTAPVSITVEWEETDEHIGATAIIELDADNVPCIASDTLSAESMEFVVQLAEFLVDGTAS